jgi:hypothetical protein
MNKWVRLGVYVIGGGALLGMGITMYITFLWAYFQGYKTTVLINAFGEAGFEFFFIPLMLVFGMFFVWDVYGRLIVKKEQLR